MSLREEQCNKVCRILDDVLANRPTERDSLIVAVRKAFAEPQIVRCKDCRYYKQFGKSDWGDCLALSRICKSIDFCSWGARMDSEQILSEADNDTAYGGLMSAT